MESRELSVNYCSACPACSAEFMAFPSFATAWSHRRFYWYLSISVATLQLLCFWSPATHAADPGINKNWRSIAIKGYDPVAYFTMSKAVEGKSKYEYRWHDARWRFVSEEHLRMFSKDPEQYAPRFGGYCAEGMSLGRKASIDPQAWLIVDGELYLNYSVEVRDEMATHPQKSIEEADRVWDKLQSLLRDR